MKNQSRSCMNRKAHALFFPMIFAMMLLMIAGPVYGADVIKLGAVYPLSGGVAESASYCVDGVKMAVNEINENGGLSIKGKMIPVELVLYDSKCNPTNGVAAVEKMLNRDKVIAISGDYCSSCCLAEREVSGRHKVAQITPVALHPKITEPGYPYMFRICNTMQMYAEPFVEFVDQKLDVQSVAFLAITDDYGRAAIEAYTRLFPEKGIEVWGVEYFKHGDTDFYTQLTKIIKKNPDAVYIVTDENAQNIGALSQLKELGFNGTIFGCSTYAKDDMIELGGKELLEGMYIEGPTFEMVKDKESVKTWMNAYEREFDRGANTFALRGYNTIELLADAIRRADTVKDTDKIRDAVASANLTDVLTGYIGNEHFDDNGQVYPSMGVIQYVDGKRVPVYWGK